jgi:hypothetical protein
MLAVREEALVPARAPVRGSEVAAELSLGVGGHHDRLCRGGPSGESSEGVSFGMKINVRKYKAPSRRRLGLVLRARASLPQAVEA